MSNQNSLIEISNALKTAKRLIVVSHVDPDSDAYGSICGLALSLSESGASVVCCNQSGQLDHFQEFPGIELVQDSFPAAEEGDVIVVCDCGDFSRVGDEFRVVIEQRQQELVNIDHHYSNGLFGTLNIVDENASSTSEIIYRLLEAMNCAVPVSAAEALYAGISGDTGSFKYSSTTAETFRVASKLVDHGVDPGAVSQQLYGNVRLTAARLQARAITDMQVHFDGLVSEIVVSKELLDEYSATPFDTERLVESARDIKGVKIAIFIREHGDVWKVSLRSKSDLYNVSLVAQSFGGGGHRAAAAFRWRKSLDELRKGLIARVGELLEQIDD